ncbi:MAG TPA: bifunctional hydroxymethylpyrimidine kinase/phosphomethylpyrimidine kinase [Solirubrobacteraceae bacterium]|nr:bifunctional hydroxymethylpyrimidine kinase/phosphomethylpyrimidine kinase [Solirubrobacteraceae bacterium]
MERTPTALSIAGSDSGGGAGIEADLKAFARCGVHGTVAITAITAQNTLGVDAVHAVPPETILAQVRAVLSDIRVDAVKVGMLGTAESAVAVAQALEELPRGTPVVVDPVMVAESGARLLQRQAQAVLIERILPRATVLTPNLIEARALVEDAASSAGAGAGAQSLVPAPAGAEHPGGEDREVEELVRALLKLGPDAVVVTGGHRERSVDLFLESRVGAEPVEIEGVRYADGAAHGSGCTHSSLLAAQLALGGTPLQAARVARALTGEAVRDGLRDVGAGAGPVDVLGLAAIRARGVG